MLENIRTGLTGEKTVEVTHNLTIASLNEKLPAVYSTPAMILLMEMAAASLIHPLLPAGHISVGTEVNIRHLAATPLGDHVTATARVLEIAGNLVKFEVEARDSRLLIGSGTHTRAVIEIARFMRRLENRN
jgi:predicted thioesterase